MVPKTIPYMMLVCAGEPFLTSPPPKHELRKSAEVGLDFVQVPSGVKLLSQPKSCRYPVFSFSDSSEGNTIFLN